MITEKIARQHRLFGPPFAPCGEKGYPAREENGSLSRSVCIASRSVHRADFFLTESSKRVSRKFRLVLTGKVSMTRKGLGWICLVLGLLLGIPSPTPGQQFVEKVYQDAAGPHKYTVFVPTGYSANRKYPVILYLHGAGERGTDGRKPTLVGLGPYAKAWGNKFPFVVVFPQVEDTRSRLLTAWQAGTPDAERALKILDEVLKTYSVDPRRVALVGWSMGGYGAWSLGAAYPERWSAVMPLSGGGNPETVAGLKTVPVWAFHGARDQLVPVSESQRMVQALKDAGGNVSYDELPEAGHEIFAQVFGNEAVLAWLLDPRGQPARLSTKPASLQVEPPPFVPAVEIPQAMGFRLGNDALKALSYAAPQMVPPNMLRGRLNDMYHSTVVQGRSFSITFSGISYSGQLHRVQVQAVGDNRVNIQLGLRNITLVIGGTYVSGARHAAQAGPIGIYIGHNRPVWLSLDVAPYIENRRIRLRTVGASFSIPPDSFSVSGPAGVSVQGFGMTQERVSSGLVSGLYGARSRIENEVTAIVPNIVRQLEERLQIDEAGPVVGSLWPLPVYQPRLRVYPDQIATDNQGVTVVLGVSAAAPDFSGPAQPVRAESGGVSLRSLSTDKYLHVAVAPRVLEPLTQMLIERDLARIDLLDVPEKSFHRLSDRQVLEEILPDLKRFDPQSLVRTELVLAAPLKVTTGTTAASGSDPSVPLELQLPQVRVEVSLQAPGQRTWQPYAQFELQVKESVAATLHKPSHQRRILELTWLADRSLTGQGRFAPGIEPQDATIHIDRFLELFRESWQRWTEAGPAASSTVPDLEFGQTKLRLEGLLGEGEILAGVFRVPTVKITNLSEERFVYETKGPYSGWGGPYTLEPGKSHEFDIPYPLTYRHTGKAGTEVYTLFAGSHSEYRVPRAGGPPRLFQAKE